MKSDVTWVFWCISTVDLVQLRVSWCLRCHWMRDHKGDDDYKRMGNSTVGRMYIYTEQLSDGLWLQIQLGEMMWIIELVVEWWVVMVCEMTWIFGLLLSDEWLWFVRWHEYLGCCWLMGGNVFVWWWYVTWHGVCHVTSIIGVEALSDDLSTIFVINIGYDPIKLLLQRITVECSSM